MRKLLMVIGLSMIAGVCSPTAAQALTEGCFTYTVSGSNATITNTSACSGVVDVPSTLGGYSVTTIGSFGFWDNPNITSVTLPDSVITLNTYSFHYLAELTYLNLGNGVTTLGSFFVDYSPKLSTIVLGSGFRRLGTYSMTGNTSLKTLSLPEGTTTIDSFAFRNSSIETVTVPATVVNANSYAFASSPLASATYAGNSGPVMSELISVFGHCGWTGPNACTTGPAFKLSKTSVEATNRAAVSSYSITTTRGSGTTYSISPAIGNGLSFNAATGLISGRPIADAPAVTYTITASNSSGSATATFSISVISNIQKFNCSPFMTRSINVQAGDLLIFSSCPQGSITSVNTSVIETSTSDSDFGSPTFTVQISNTVGPGTYLNAFTLSTFGTSNQMNLTVSTVTTPSAPTLTSVTGGTRQLVIAFTAGSDGGATISDYKYSLNGGAYISAGTYTSPFTISGLLDGTAYSVTIRARNSQGDGTVSNAISATTSGSAVLPVPIPIPEPIQQSKINSISISTAVSGTPTPIVIAGSFIEKISAIHINGISLPAGSWTQTPTSVSLTVPGKTAGNYQIQLYNGSIPVLAVQNFTFTALPAAIVVPVVKGRITFIKCEMPGRATRLKYGVNPVCPAGYVKK